MATCLGLYIENNIIKYAKVSKERDQMKVESYGVRCFDDINKAIKQVIEETDSYKVPVCVNLSEEIYNFFYVFALLNKNDIPKAIKTEFESYCASKNYNPNAFETRYAITPMAEDKEKLRVIHISANKIELNKRIQEFGSYKLQKLIPVSMTIPNITKFEPKERSLIVNIEEKTTVTTIYNQNIYDIKILDIGSQDILNKISAKENSYQKAYEICKETTIYTSESNNISEEDTSHLEDIMPTLYDIVGQLRKILNESVEKIEKIYITGTGALINNIDLYFEEYLEEVKCEILKPNFIKISPDINIKDYVEVNSAISLALSGLGEGISNINFKKNSFMESLPDILKIEVGGSKKGGVSNKGFDKSKISFDLSTPLDRVEKNLLRSSIGVLILFIVYCSFSTLLKNQMTEKEDEAQNSINNTNAQIALIDKDINSLKSIESEYETKVNNLQEIKNKLTQNNRTKKSIPILLNRLMYIMPEGVQITSIENTSSTHIVIQAQSKQYAQLGYLTATIDTKMILTNVISTSGQKDNSIITIKIEGDLP